MEITFSFLVHISKKEKKKKKGGGMEVWKSIINDKIFPSGRLKYSVPPSPSLWGTFPPPPLKLSTCKRYVGICREINIWSFALEKQLERS